MRLSLGRSRGRRLLGYGTLLAASGLWASSASAQYFHDASDKAEGRYTGRAEAAGGPENAYEANDDSSYDASSNRGTRAADNNQDRAGRGRSNDRDRNGAMEDDANSYRQADRDRGRQTSDRSNDNNNRRAYSRDQNRGDNDRERHATGRDQNMGVTWSNRDDRLVADRVDRNGEMARAGLEKGDQLTSVNGQRVRTQAELNRALASAQPGRQAALGIRRDGQRETIYFVPNARQFSNNHFSNNGNYGRNSARDNDSHANQMADSTHNAFLGVQLDERYPHQAVVRQVYHNSPAEKSGLRPGDVILAVNGQQITSAQQLTHEVASMEPGKAANIHISRSQTRDVEVHLGTRNAQASYQQDDRDRSQRNSSTAWGGQPLDAGEAESERDQAYDRDNVGTSQD